MQICKFKLFESHLAVQQPKGNCMRKSWTRLSLVAFGAATVITLTALKATQSTRSASDVYNFEPQLPRDRLYLPAAESRELRRTRVDDDHGGAVVVIE